MEYEHKTIRDLPTQINEITDWKKDAVFRVLTSKINQSSVLLIQRFKYIYIFLKNITKGHLKMVGVVFIRIAISS